MSSWISKSSLIIAALMATFLSGFLTGRWAFRKESKPQQITIGSVTPKPEQDLSPKGETRTVILTKIVHAPPEKPPVPVPADLGQETSSTSTVLPGGTFHTATFAKLDGLNLEQRTIQWMDSPGGPVSIGPTETRETPLKLDLPRVSAIPNWSVLALATVRDHQVRPGVLGTWAHGPWTVAAGVLDRQAVFGGGIRF